MKNMIFIAAAICLVMSCSSYHTDSILRGKSISKDKVEQLQIGTTTRTQVQKLFGDPYYEGNYGEETIIGYVFLSGKIVSHEHTQYGFRQIQPKEFPDLADWQKFTYERGDKIAVAEFVNWNDASLWLRFKDDVLTEFTYYYTPAAQSSQNTGTKK